MGRVGVACLATCVLFAGALAAPKDDGKFKLLAGKDFGGKGTVLPHDACETGDDVSPQLRWVNPPPETESFVLVVSDPGTKNTHWIVYDIPAKADMLDEQLSMADGLSTVGTDERLQGKGPNNLDPITDEAKLDCAAKEGVGSMGHQHWKGPPCTTPGAKLTFKLYAVKKRVLWEKVRPGSTKEEILAMTKGAILGKATLTVQQPVS